MEEIKELTAQIIQGIKTIVFKLVTGVLGTFRNLVNRINNQL